MFALGKTILSILATDFRTEKKPGLIANIERICKKMTMENPKQRATCQDILDDNFLASARQLTKKEKYIWIMNPPEDQKVSLPK